MVEKKTDDNKEKRALSESAEIFEGIFKAATSGVQRETGRISERRGLKPKPKPEAKSKPDAKPKAPIKLELDSAPEPQAERLQEKMRSGQNPSPQPPTFKSRQDPSRRPVTRTSGPGKVETDAGLLTARPSSGSRIEEQKTKVYDGQKDSKLNPPRGKNKVSPVLGIFLFVLLIVAVGGASVYLGLIDVSDFIGRSEPAKQAAPKVSGKPSQPAALKPSVPAQTQAQPAEAPDATSPPPSGQVPQVSPKPDEPVAPPRAEEAQAPAPRTEIPAEPAKAPSQTAPAASPSQPPEVPAKPVTPSGPPAVAKAETPLSPVQPQANFEKSETSSPGPEPKKAAAAKTAPIAGGSGAAYPFSVYLGSVQGMDYVKRAISSYKAQGRSIYWSKVDLGAKGTWYRLFTGYFRNATDAEMFIQQLRIKEGEVKETRYANLIGTFGTKQGGEAKATALADMGLSAYSIQAADGQVRVYSGAFITRGGAEKNQVELNAKGIKSEIVER